MRTKEVRKLYERKGKRENKNKRRNEKKMKRCEGEN